MTKDEVQRLEARMWNWGRWASGCGVIRQRCASAEGAYDAPSWEGEKLEALASAPVDLVDAERVELALQKLMRGERQILVAIYAKRWDKYEISRKLRFHVKLFEPAKLKILTRFSSVLADAAAITLIRRGKPIWAGVSK